MKPTHRRAGSSQQMSVSRAKPARQTHLESCCEIGFQFLSAGYGNEDARVLSSRSRLARERHGLKRLSHQTDHAAEKGRMGASRPD
jgi:hypothetical protein